MIQEEKCETKYETTYEKKCDTVYDNKVTSFIFLFNFNICNVIFFSVRLFMTQFKKKNVSQSMTQNVKLNMRQVSNCSILYAGSKIRC